MAQPFNLSLETSDYRELVDAQARQISQFQIKEIAMVRSLQAMQAKIDHLEGMLKPKEDEEVAPQVGDMAVNGST